MYMYTYIYRLCAYIHTYLHPMHLSPLFLPRISGRQINWPVGATSGLLLVSTCECPGIVCCTDTNARLMHLNGILHKDMQRHTLTPAPTPIYVCICIRIHTYVPTPNASIPSFRLSRHCLSLMRRSRATFIVALSPNPPWKGNPRNVPCARGLPTCETLMFCTCGQTAAQIFPKDGLQAT